MFHLLLIGRKLCVKTEGHCADSIRSADRSQAPFNISTISCTSTPCVKTRKQLVAVFWYLKELLSMLDL